MKLGEKASSRVCKLEAKKKTKHGYNGGGGGEKDISFPC